jgi:glycosyltransferase involved in cell wall biosynthesis
VAPVPDLLVFIPAWNEEDNLGAVLDELHRDLPGADVLVIDDGSTDGTARVAREHGADVHSFGENRGLRAGIAAGYTAAYERGYQIAGRVDADGQHPVSDLARLISLVRSGRCDVAVGSRYLSGPSHQPHRYRLEGARRLGTAVMRRTMGILLRHPFHDPMSGMYAVNARAMPVLARPYSSGAPEVEALMRIREEGLRLEEVPVDMRARSGGESKLRGRKAAALVVTVAAAVWAGRRLLRR